MIKKHLFSINFLRMISILCFTWNPLTEQFFKNVVNKLRKTTKLTLVSGCYWPFVRGIHRLPVNSPHKGQWRGALMFSLICPWINGWVNNREAGDLRFHGAHYDVIVMKAELSHWNTFSFHMLYNPAPLHWHWASHRAAKPTFLSCYLRTSMG